MQPMFHKPRAKASGVATSQLESTGPATHLPVFSASGGYRGPGRGRLVTANKTPDMSLVGAASSAPVQTAAKPVLMPRCVILKPVCTMGLATVIASRPNTPAAENKPRMLLPAVHSTIRQILVPRVIPRATFSVPASTAVAVGSRKQPAHEIVHAKTMAVRRPQRPQTAATNSLHGLAVIRPSTDVQPAAAEGVGRESPLSCIQTIVANAAATTQWIAVNDGTCDINSSAVGQCGPATSDKDETVIHLAVSADNRGFAAASTDDADLKRASCTIRKRLSTTNDLKNKTAKYS